MGNDSNSNGPFRNEYSIYFTMKPDTLSGYSYDLNIDLVQIFNFQFRRGTNIKPTHSLQLFFSTFELSGQEIAVNLYNCNIAYRYARSACNFNNNKKKNEIIIIITSDLI